MKANRRPVLNKEFQQKSLFGPFMQGGTKLVYNKFKFEQWKVKNNPKTRVFNLTRCLHYGLGGTLPKNVDKGIIVM